VVAFAFALFAVLKRLRPSHCRKARAALHHRRHSGLLDDRSGDVFYALWCVAAGRQFGVRVTIRVKRVYEEADNLDGRRILVDRLWPQGLSKAKADLDIWMKEISPSTELRRWYGHDPDRWSEFKARYVVELNQNQSSVEKLLAEVQMGTVTLLYASKQRKLNNAVALKEYLESITPVKTV
jgi:uncharacterized protein YeaO (DUF488 family)